MVKQLSLAEQKCWKNAHFFHREFVEVMGTPSSIELDHLESTACRTVKGIAVYITGKKIDAFHRLGKNNYKT